MTGQAADRSPMKVLSILARHGTIAYPDAARDMDAIFARQLPALEHDTVIVDNDLPSGYDQVTGDGRVVAGDNRAWEFSAFDRALEIVGDRVWSYDFVHLATAAFNTLYVEYLNRFSTSLLEAARDWPVCIGHIDCYNEPVWLMGYRSQHWIRTCFFFVRPSELVTLGSLASLKGSSGFFTGRAEEPFVETAPLSARYREYVTDWLTGGDIGQGVRWHTRLELTSESLSRFQEKARAIFNEHLLAVRLRALGCALVDVTWLSSVLSRGDRVDWRTDWRRQLAGRDRDRVVVSDQESPVAG
jgi:hypothetical protein